MSKINFCFLFLFVLGTLQAQNYYIKFTGAGETTTLSTIKVDNLTKGISVTLNGTDTLLLSGNIGINKIITDKNNRINIYPNPMSGQCSFDFNFPEAGNVTIGLYDLTGKLLVSKKEQVFRGFNSYNLQGINSGVYVLKIASDTYSWSSKIVCQNGVTGKAQISQTSESNMISFVSAKSGRKSTNSVVGMSYSVGDVVVAEGTSSAGGPVDGYVTTLIIDPTTTETVVFDFFSCVDKDGISYSVTKIGTQFWLTENLKTTKYNNGSPITNVTDNMAWGNLHAGAYCWYENDSLKYSGTYGALYNWYTVNLGILCPLGWRVPTQNDWITMNTLLGGDMIAGGKLKETGFTHWLSPNTAATNETRFTALPGGSRDINGAFAGLGETGGWWLSTEVSSGSAKYSNIISSAAYAFNSNTFNKTNGLSVRCIKE